MTSSSGARIKPHLHEKESSVEIKATRLAAQRAYAMAGVGPGDIDLAEVHDGVMSSEIFDALPHNASDSGVTVLDLLANRT